MIYWKRVKSATRTSYSNPKWFTKSYKLQGLSRIILVYWILVKKQYIWVAIFKRVKGFYR
jgi:hypothetical protein